MTVDGETLDVTGVVRCIPFDASEFGGAEGDPNELDIVIFGGTGGLSVNDSTTPSQTLQGETYDRSINRLRFNRGNDQYENVAGSLPDGTWVLGSAASLGDPGEGTPIDEPPFTVDGNNIRGAMTLEQNWPEGADGTADVTFDVVFPSEEMDCSL